MKNPEEINLTSKIKDDNLIDVRCTFSNRSKSDGKIYPCNRVCVQVMPGSAGKARCRSCRLYFLFDIDENAQNSTGIRVQKLQ